MTAFELDPRLLLDKLAVFGLRREHGEKQIEREWNLDQRQIATSEYAPLRNFLTTNLAILLNMKETIFVKGDPGSEAPLTFSEGRRGGKPGKAFVVDFQSSSSRQQILDEARGARDIQVFNQIASAIAQRFLDRPFWPKSYLFIAQYRISHNDFENQFLAIFTTQLQYGKFVEDADKIVDQLEKAMVGDKVKKVLVYPILKRENDHLDTDPKVKVYEEVRQPAAYFYEFLELNEPINAQARTETQYAEIRSTQQVSLNRLIMELDEIDQRIIDSAKVDVEIGEIKIKTSLRNLAKHFHFVRVHNRYVVLIEGNPLNVFLGGNELVYDQAIEVTDKESAVEFLSRRTLGR